VADPDLFDQIKLFLPKYLSPDQQHRLFAELSTFPENRTFYLSRSNLLGELLQGDGWRGFVAINFHSGDRRTISGMVISNSCDISPANMGSLPVNIVFAPLIELAKYVERLRGVGKTSEQIENLLRDIRRQRVSSMFFLPECPGVIPECIVLLDDLHAHPLRDFLDREKSALFTLNQYAFYLFLMKLSIHFSRFQEGAERFDSAA